MAQRTASSDSQSSSTQKPFVRSGDIGCAGCLIGIISVLLFVGVLVVLAVLFGDPNQFPPGVSLLVAGVPSAVFWVASYLLVRRKYGLSWSEVGLTFANWQRGLLWAVGLFPLALLACWLEDLGWRWLIYHHLVQFLGPWQSPLDLLADWGKNADVIALCEMVIAIIVIVISQGVFFWGMGYNAIERRTSSIVSGILIIALVFLLIYLMLPGAPILLSLPFGSACIITFAYRRTRTLLTPSTMAIAIFLSFLFVQPAWYTVDRLTIHENCICAEDGTPLSNEIVTVDGKDYQNVTVVKWSAGSAVEKGGTTTSPSGSSTLNFRRGFNLKLTITSTHYHRHGTGPDATFKKCTYSYTEMLGHSEVGDSAKVERNTSAGSRDSEIAHTAKRPRSGDRGYWRIK